MRRCNVIKIFNLIKSHPNPTITYLFLYSCTTFSGIFYRVFSKYLIFSGGVKNKKYTTINTIKNSIMEPIDLMKLLDFKKPNINKEIDIAPKNNKIIDIEYLLL
ncbi:hypothetical protein BK821_03860 [Staphylococcus sp. LCT-H4]|nr:hypothetical protein BK821_03860 [Staphylococcus sp. LCT-H4]